MVGKQGDEAITTEKAKAPSNSESASIRNGAVDAAMTAGGTKLHPQPTDDALDPLNWSRTTKHVILAIVMFKYAQTLCHSSTNPTPSGYFLDDGRLTNCFSDTSYSPTSRQQRSPPFPKFRSSSPSHYPRSTGPSPFPPSASPSDPCSGPRSATSTAAA